MKPTMDILEKINQNSTNNKDEIFTRLYRYLLRPDIYYVAYKKLYSNSGASTKGINEDTADGFSESKIMKIIKSLADETYKPNPSRRIYITKANGKMRPLGIPTFTDKLVQEALRMILEAVYEPIFLDSSHGFRPNRSCHTALKAVKNKFHGTNWFVEGDIKGCFDNINHTVLIRFINNKIKDARLIKLLYKFLKAGYMEDWKYNNTYSGTPQGGIVSPLLANIYLHELDKFMEELKSKFDKPRERMVTKEYKDLSNENYTIRKKIKNANEADRKILLDELKQIRAVQFKTPYKSNTDKKIKYIRYCDDFLIGVNGSKEDCEWIKKELKEFISSTLKMELSEEKTLITYSNNYARFLGYDIRVRRNNRIGQGGNGYSKRTFSYRTELNIPLKDKIEKFLFEKEIAKIKDGMLFPIARNVLLGLTDLEILASYNSELRGICNYYNMAGNFSSLNYFAYLMEYNCIKTLAGKHKTTIAKIKEKYKDGKGKWCIPYESKKGIKHLYFANFQDSKKVKVASDIKSNKTVMFMHSTTTFENRLKAKKCELCGDTESEEYEIHHINKVKNLKGKELWEKVMIAKRRKTIVVCKKCHHKIHNN